LLAYFTDYKIIDSILFHDKFARVVGARDFFYYL